jgi:hypothetical protein
METVEKLFAFIKNRDLNPLVGKGLFQVNLLSIIIIILRASTESYIKEVSKTLCALDFSLVGTAFTHTLAAALEGLSLTREMP